MNAESSSRPAAFLRLIRIWNLPTALADSYAGYLLAALPGGISLPRLLGVMALSGLIYSAGMAWNDILDLERDRTLHPDRPLPSGAIPSRVAARLAAGLIILGLIVSVFLGTFILLASLALVVLTFTYNAGLKHRGFIGCANMGACRFINMWLGIAAAGGSMAHLWAFPLTLGLYVTVVTLISLQEEVRIGRLGFCAAVAVLLSVPAPLAVFSVAWAGREPVAWLALVPLAFLAAWVIVAAASAVRRLSPASVGSLIRVCLTGIILLDSAMLLSRGKLIAGMLCALMILPTLMLIKHVARHLQQNAADAARA